MPLTRVFRLPLAGVLALAPVVGVSSSAPDASRFNALMHVHASHLDRWTEGRSDPVSDGIDLTRLFLDVDLPAGEVWSARLTTDVQWRRGRSPGDPWLRHAYLQRSAGEHAVVRVGSAPLPWAPFAMRWAGYGYVEKGLASRLGFGGAADWGIHLAGDSDSNLAYAVAVVSGGGFQRPRIDAGSPDLEARLAWQPSAPMVVAVGGYRGRRALGGGRHYAYHTARRWNGLVAFANERVRLGAEFFEARDWKEVRSPQGDRARGWSAWAGLRIAPSWAAFVRKDRAATSTQRDPSRRERYAHLGVEWHVDEALRLAGALKRAQLRSRHQERQRYSELGVWAQVAF